MILMMPSLFYQRRYKSDNFKRFVGVMLLVWYLTLEGEVVLLVEIHPDLTLLLTVLLV